MISIIQQVIDTLDIACPAANTDEKFDIMINRVNAGTNTLVN